MTTPNQSSPDGAVTVGGGAWKYGQAMDENYMRSSFEIEAPSNLQEALQLLPEVLAMMPGDSMKPWQKWLNLTDEDRASGAIVQHIVDSLSDNVITRTIDSMVRGLVGWAETGYTPAELEQAAKDLASSVSDLRTIVTKLTSSNGFAGTARVIDFTGMSENTSSLGAGWSQTYFGTGTGVVGISGYRARWIGAADQRWGTAVYTDAETKSDYQRIGVAFATKPSKGILGGSKSVNRIMGRVSNDAQTFVAVDFEADGFTLGCQVSGAWTTWYTRTSTLLDKWEFKPGAAYWLECGTTGGARIYRVWENGTVIASYTDSAATSIYGVGFRRIGFAMKAFADNFRPGEVGSVAFYDNQPGAFKGSGWRISRTASSNVNASGGDNSFPSSWFDTIDYATDDLVYDVTNNRITVAAEGWYQITVRQYGDVDIVGNFSTHPLLLVNGAIVQRGPLSRWGGYDTGFGGTFTVYLREGDQVKPGYWASATVLNGLRGGDAGGLETYWSGVFVGTNKKQPVEV